MTVTKKVFEEEEEEERKRCDPWSRRKRREGVSFSAVTQDREERERGVGKKEKKSVTRSKVKSCTRGIFFLSLCLITKCAVSYG